MIAAVTVTLCLTISSRTLTSAAPPPSFTITPLLLPAGSSEPEISIGQDGTMGMVSLSVGFDMTGTALWTGPFGLSPTFQGIVDAALRHPGKTIFGGEDADVDIGLTGRLHITSLIILGNPALTRGQFGVSAITCPSPAGGLSISQCTEQIIDTTRDDRPWITSEGNRVYISYHDPVLANLIHVQRSDDDGLTWKKVGDPVVGQGLVTSGATRGNIGGNIVADPCTHNVYDIYSSFETGVLKGQIKFFPNQITVSRSTDMGKNWTANVVFTATPGPVLGHQFPSLAVDSVTGNLYAVWSDGQTVSFATSTDQGNTWTPAVVVSQSPARTAIFPWVAASNGIVDVVYYGTTAASAGDPNAIWHVYFSQFSGASFTQTQVNSVPNHVGVICGDDIPCGPGARNLLDLFQVAINPQNGKAAIIYVDDTLTTTTDAFFCSSNQSPPCPLPQAVLAQEN